MAIEQHQKLLKKAETDEVENEEMERYQKQLTRNQDRYLRDLR